MPESLPLYTDTDEYSEQERVDNEKRINQLYQDITTGKLRRRGAGDFDLSDEDDDFAEKRRRKQREFARRTKALLGDEKIGKLGKSRTSIPDIFSLTS